MTTVKGMDRLRAQLNALPDAIKAEIRAAMEKSAEEIVAMARGLAPVLKEPDQRRQQGALRDSIGWTWGEAPKGAMTLGKVQADTNSDRMVITIYAGNSEAFYARWVEFGTAKMQARPFFYPSYRANRRRLRGRANRALKKAAQKVASSK